MIQGLILDIKYGLKRGEWWYFQMAVPKRLQPVYGCALLKEATGTKDDIRAAQMIAALAHRYKKEMELIDAGQLKAPKALDQAAKALLKKWGLAAHSVHNDQTLEEVFIGTLYDKDEKGVEISPAELRAAQLLASKPKDKTDILLSEMPAQYLKDHPDPHAKLQGEIERCTRFLIDSIGSDVPYKELSRDHMNGYRDYLRDVRENATATIKKRIDHLKAMFAAVSRELEINKQNPAEGIRIKNIGKDSKEREPFTDQELASINLKLDIKNDAHLILKVLMESTGRLNEITGLEKADLYLDSQTPHIAIRPNSIRRIKNKISNRLVPIVNPETLEALKSLAEESKGGALFPHWAKHLKTGSWGVGRPIAEYLHSLGIDKSAHHTRHTNAAQLRMVGCPDSVRCDLGGWLNKGEGSGNTYGKIEYLEIKANWLKKALEAKLGN